MRYHYAYIIEAPREIAPCYVKWPNDADNERGIIRHRFGRRCGCPSMVGCVDGIHIDITAPFHQPQRYVNRNHRYSIVQGTCDHNMLYRDAFVGQPGAVSGSVELTMGVAFLQTSSRKSSCLRMNMC